MSDSLINKYRPLQFTEVVGHAEVLAALQRAIFPETRPHTYLMTGPSGIGKTTIARIIAEQLQAEMVEIDAASHGGVEDARQIVEEGQYVSLHGSGRRALFIDECHNLSAKAWDVLLKVTEEPPPHLFFMLCTTESGKVPATMKTRAYEVALRPLALEQIDWLVGVIAELEQWTINNDVRMAIVQNSNGSPRMAINLLQSLHDCVDINEVRRVVNLMDATNPVIELCQLLMRGKPPWGEVQKRLAAIDDQSFDSASTAVGRYIATVMIRSNQEPAARNAWQLLEALMFPAAGFDRKAQFIAAIGRMLWAR